MGKLLQKLVNGIVPSWLSKVKSSADASSPKKLLLKGSTHASSATTHNAEVPPLAAYDAPLVGYDIPDQSMEDDDDSCSKACVENYGSPSLMKKERTSRMQPKSHKGTSQQDHIDPHQAHHVDVKISANQGALERDTNSRTPPGTPSSRKKQNTPSIHIDKHDHHAEKYQNHGKKQPELEKKNQCMMMPEEDDRHHHEAGSGRRSADHRELCDFLELVREGNVCVREDARHDLLELAGREGNARVRDDNRRHDVYLDNDYSAHEAAEAEEEHYTNLYHDLLGLKRKSQYLKEEEGEEEDEEESRGSGHIDTTAWGWKRRKAESGVTSCELPESICGIVGNGRAVVKHSLDPHMALWESMVEMIVGNGLWELGSLEFLLFCYLSLNEPHLHPIIHSSFLQVLKDLEKI